MPSVKYIGKPCAAIEVAGLVKQKLAKPYAWFDEEGRVELSERLSENKLIYCGRA